ncbi:hypothetical protein [Xanthobacter flavus]|uniref:hypothetical protein n=1 Tax=Xanthobacter flavus TaxID=281 RepID=UPI001AE61E87|nr:hypothetical protein [Xanthobacter flavus]MBP2147918.1 hypothetical protein [Xanthobacter flavus]
MSDIEVIEVLVPGQPGAKGDTGDKGDKGDTGDVTPAALTAVENAEAAAEAAENAALSAQEASARTAVVAASWTDLAAIAGLWAGQKAEVYGDAGTHTDPVVGGTVANSGVFAWSVSPAGWRWVSAYLNDSTLSFGPTAVMAAASGTYDTLTARGLTSLLLQAGTAAYRYVKQPLSRSIPPGGKVTVFFVVGDGTTISSRFGLFRNGTGFVSNMGSILSTTPGVIQSVVLTNTHATLSAPDLGLDTNGATYLDINYVVMPGAVADLSPADSALISALLGLGTLVANPPRDTTVRNIGLVNGPSTNTSMDTLTVNGLGDLSIVEASGAASYARTPIVGAASGSKVTMFYRVIPIDDAAPVKGSIKVSLEWGGGSASSEVQLVADGRLRSLTMTATAAATRMLWNASTASMRIIFVLLPGDAADSAAPTTGLHGLFAALSNLLAPPPAYETWTKDDTLILWPTPVAFVTGRDTRIFTRQVLKGRQRQANLDVSLISPAAEGDNNPGFNELLGPTLRLKGEQLKGSVCFFDVRGGNIPIGQVRRRTFTCYLASSIQTGTIQFCMLGDSTAALALNALRQRVNASGATLQGVGTLSSGGIAYEGRAGWSALNYLGKSRPAANPFLRSLAVATPADLTIIQAHPTLCFANDDPALSYAPGTGTRTSYAEDLVSGQVKASYSLFDWSYWRTNGAVNLAGTEKLRVGFQLGRNGTTSATWVADNEVAQTWIVENFRSTFPNGTIFVASEAVGEASDTANFASAPSHYRDRTSDLIKMKLKNFSNREADRVWLVPAWAMQNAFGGFKASVAAETDTDTGTVTYNVEDVVHYNGELAIQWAEAMLGPLLYVHQAN